MTPKLRARLGQLVPRLGSTFDGEKLATIRAITAALVSEGRDLNDLGNLIASENGPSPAPSRPAAIEPTPIFGELSHFERRAWLQAIAQAEWLGPLERERIAEVQSLERAGADYRIPKRSVRIVDAAIARAHAAGVRP